MPALDWHLRSVWIQSGAQHRQVFNLVAWCKSAAF